MELNGFCDNRHELVIHIDTLTNALPLLNIVQKDPKKKICGSQIVGVYDFLD